LKEDMRRLDLQPAPDARDLDEIPFKSLYVKEIYDAHTADGWVLQISRYRPVPQQWEQPIFAQPILLVPGWSQNRHAFTCGDFVKHLLAFGADIHILELRGHGRSSRELQIERAARDAGSFLAAAGAVVLYLLIVLSPLLVVALLAAWGTRVYRARAERRLLA